MQQIQREAQELLFLCLSFSKNGIGEVNMSLLEELKELGVNVDEGLERLGGNQGLYERLLGSFLKTMETHHVEPDFDTSDYAEIIEKTHAIKGTSGNLSLTPIYEAYTEIVALLRADQPEQAKKVLEGVLPVQDKIIQCIERHIK